MNPDNPNLVTHIHVGSRSTCLYCYFPFHVERASAHCPRCGEINLKEDQKHCWTREPGLVRLEGTLKGIVALFICALMVVMLIPGNVKASSGLASGWAIGAPLLLGWLLWETAGLVTRRRAALNMRIVWPMLFVCVGVGPTLFLSVLALITRNPAEGVARMLPILKGGVLWTIPWLIPAWLCSLLAGRFVRWRGARIASGAANDEATAPAVGVS